MNNKKLPPKIKIYFYFFNAFLFYFYFMKRAADGLKRTINWPGGCKRWLNSSRFNRAESHFQSPATAHAQYNSHVFVHQRQWLVPFLKVAGMQGQ